MQFRSSITLIEDTGSDDKLFEDLKASRAATYKGGEPVHVYNNHCGIFYSAPNSGEPITNPKTRICSFRVLHFKHLVGTVLKVRALQDPSGEQGILPSDVYLLHTGGKEGNEAGMLGVFTTSDGAMPKQKTDKTLMFDEESVRQRGKCRGNISQTDPVMIVSRHVFPWGVKAKLHFPGTVRGMIIGPMVLPDYSDKFFWKATLAEKKIYMEFTALQSAGPKANQILQTPLPRRSRRTTRKPSSSTRRTKRQQMSWPIAVSSLP